MNEISYSSQQPAKRKLSKRLMVFAAIFLIGLLLLGGLFYFVTRDSGEVEEDTTSIELSEDTEPEIIDEPTQTPVPEESVTPSVTPKDDEEADQEASKARVAVQNGSGESGVAGAAAEILREAGYTISSTGNADNFDYQDVTIRVKNSKKSILADLEEALSEDYTIGDTSTDLGESTNYDALVIIGS